MIDFGHYTLSFTPGVPDPDSGVLDHSVEMRISGEASLTQLAEVFTDFLKANGYQFNYFEVHK